MRELLEIVELGHPFLRKKAKHVRTIKNPVVQTLVGNMISTLVHVGGMGIAAPQVNESLRVFIIASHPTPNYPQAEEMEPTAIINPQILDFSKKLENGWEGCLSIPGIRAMIPRNRWVSVRYRTRDGMTKEDVFRGFVARIFQHEYDHLNGIVYLDRITSTHNIITEKEFTRLMEGGRR